MFCILTKSLLFLSLQKKVITPYPHNFQKERENMRALKNSVNTKWNKGGRELFTIQFALHSFTPKINNKSVHWETNNYVASLIVTSGSNKVHLKTLAENLYELTIKHSIVLQVKRISRHKNQLADALSKTYDFDDWETTDTLLHYLNRLWGPFTIDRFADNKNARLRKFNSKFWCPNTSQVDKFAIGWENDNNYMVLPIYSVPKLIKHLQSSKGSVWPSAPVWPFYNPTLIKRIQ